MKIITRKELEKLLKISRTTIYRWCNDGTLPKPFYMKKGSKQYWRETEILTWLENK